MSYVAARVSHGDMKCGDGASLTDGSGREEHDLRVFVLSCMLSMYGQGIALTGGWTRHACDGGCHVS